MITYSRKAEKRSNDSSLHALSCAAGNNRDGTSRDTFIWHLQVVATVVDWMYVYHKTTGPSKLGKSSYLCHYGNDLWRQNEAGASRASMNRSGRCNRTKFALALFARGRRSHVSSQSLLIYGQRRARLPQFSSECASPRSWLLSEDGTHIEPSIQGVYHAQLEPRGHFRKSMATPS